MSNPLNISDSDVLAVLTKMFDLPASEIELGEWECRPMDAGGSQATGGAGLLRVSGSVRLRNVNHTWSVIVKAFSISTAFEADNVESWSYWKREFLAYQSGILNHLPAGIVAPHCYLTEERNDGTCVMWIEAIQESMTEWTMDRYALAARHLGQFNGAYLCGEKLPLAQPWLSWGRCRQYAQLLNDLLPQMNQVTITPNGRRVYPNNSFDRVPMLLAQRERMLNALEHLPVCFCHHDAFRSNLIDRVKSNGMHETVAIDWAITGFGRIGEEIGVMTGVGLHFLRVPAKDALLLDEAAFTGYLDGLRDAGWRGDPRIVRLGYTICISALQGYGLPMATIYMMQDPVTSRNTQAIFKHTEDEILDAWGEVTSYYLDRCDEALALVDELNLD